MTVILRLKLFSTTTIWKYEYLIHFYFQNAKLYDNMFCYGQLISFCFGIYSKWTYYFRKLSLVWKYYYELVVVNVDQYQHCYNPNSMKRMLDFQMKKHLNLSNSWWRYLFCKLFYRYNFKWNIWIQKDFVNLRRFCRETLSCFKTISLKSKIKLVLFVKLIDDMCLSIHYGFGEA